MKLKLYITNIVFFISASALITSCATYQEQMGRDFSHDMINNDNQGNLLHEVVVVGDAGNANEPKGKQLLQTVEGYLKEQNNEKTLLFIGDNIYPLGMPKENSKHRQRSEEHTSELQSRPHLVC